MSLNLENKTLSQLRGDLMRSEKKLIKASSKETKKNLEEDIREINAQIEKIKAMDGKVKMEFTDFHENGGPRCPKCKGNSLYRTAIGAEEGRYECRKCKWQSINRYDHIDGNKPTIMKITIEEAEQEEQKVHKKLKRVSTKKGETGQ